MCSCFWWQACGSPFSLGITRADRRTYVDTLLDLDGMRRHDNFMTWRHLETCLFAQERNIEAVKSEK